MTNASIVDEANPWPPLKSALIISCVIIKHINIPALSGGLILHSCHRFGGWNHLTIHLWRKKGVKAIGTVALSDLSLYSSDFLKMKISL